jgi:hypothetical protein
VKKFIFSGLTVAENREETSPLADQVKYQEKEE